MALLSRLQFTRPDRGLFPGVFSRPKQVEITVHGGPDGLNALFVSDVHLRRGVSQARLDALMDQLAAAQADLLLLGGDYAETPDQCLRFFHALKRVRFPLGGFAVLGNNDWKSRADLPEMAREAGLNLLQNEARTLALPHCKLEIAGCDDYKHGTPQTQNLFCGKADYRIFLSHYPILPDCSCDLMLSGHTHAGQCNLWGITPYTMGFERRYRLAAIRGYHHFPQMDLLVGNGIGVSRFPFRLGAQPQFYLLKFTK